MDRSKFTALYRTLTTRLLDRFQDVALLLVRITWGWQFFETGLGKLRDLDKPTQFFASLGIPLPGINAAFIGTLECVGGILLLLGLATRLVSPLLVGSMTVAFVTADREALFSLFSDPSRFVSAAPAPFLAAALIAMAFGAGRLSLDRLIQRLASRGAAAPAQPAATLRERVAG